MWCSDGTSSRTQLAFQLTNNDLFVDFGCPARMSFFGDALYLPVPRTGPHRISQDKESTKGLRNMRAMHGFSQAVVISDVDTAVNS